MRYLVTVTSCLLLLGCATMANERAVNKGERARLAAAVKAHGCTGGKMEFDIDDHHYEVEHARCKDGHKYELTFDTKFKLIEKEREH